MYSSAKSKQDRCLFSSELRSVHRESGCANEVPVTCAGVGSVTGFSPLNGQSARASASTKCATAQSGTTAG